MRIGVIGAGPVGGILAALLIKSGEDVFIVDVDREVLAAAKASGLKITGPAAAKLKGEFTAKPADAFADISEAGSADLVFVCVKTTVLEAVAANLAKAWRPGTLLVSFQNGIDPEDRLAEVAGPDHTLRVVVDFAGHAVAPGVYALNWVHPPNFIGSLTEKGRGHAERIAELLGKAGLTTNAVGDIKRRAFRKTALNATLCPVCALTGLTMGEAMTQPDTRSLAVALLMEARTVGEKMGWRFERPIEDWLRYLEAGGQHKTSMAEDMAAGRRTEIGFMNGKIYEYGARLGVPVPYNHAMSTLVLGIEARMQKQQAVPANPIEGRRKK